tara:strand:- start:45 stop:557 length:513 start_codon:yes stop_codon:yes gene_type:complete
MMKHRTKLLSTFGIVAALGIGGFAVVSHADSDSYERGRHGSGYSNDHEGYGKSGGKHAKSAMRMLERYDVNEDGALGLDEIRGERERSFKAADADADGALTLQEYEGLWLQTMRPRMVKSFQKHDDDGDGRITSDDYSNRFYRMMTWMDQNEDGQIDAKDMRSNMRRHHE